MYFHISFQMSKFRNDLKMDALAVVDSNLDRVLGAVAQGQWEKEVVRKLKNPHTIRTVSGQARALMGQVNAKYSRRTNEKFTEPDEVI